VPRRPPDGERDSRTGAACRLFNPSWRSTGNANEPRRPLCERSTKRFHAGCEHERHGVCDLVFEPVAATLLG